MAAHPNVISCRGLVAAQRGPIIYGFEGLDNPAALNFGEDPHFQIEHRPELLGGITVIHCINKNGEAMTAIPFYALANRTPSTQEIWIRQFGLALDDSWWEGRLYRPIGLVNDGKQSGLKLQ
jgi:DUF1680 family protein